MTTTLIFTPNADKKFKSTKSDKKEIPDRILLNTTQWHPLMRAVDVIFNDVDPEKSSIKQKPLF